MTDKERADALSLDDLSPLKVRVEIEHGDRVVVVPLRTLPFFEWVRLGYEVANPVPPTMGVDKNGRPLLDTRDPGYLRALDEAGMERAYVRLLAALDIPIPGDTREEKLAALKAKLDTNVARQLNGVLNQMASEGEARIVARSETFLGDGPGDPAGVPGERVDAPAV
jgi:hypothetical protein